MCPFINLYQVLYITSTRFIQIPQDTSQCSIPLIQLAVFHTHFPIRIHSFLSYSWITRHRILICSPDMWRSRSPDPMTKYHKYEFIISTSSVQFIVRVCINDNLETWQHDLSGLFYFCNYKLNISNLFKIYYFSLPLVWFHFLWWST